MLRYGKQVSAYDIYVGYDSNEMIELEKVEINKNYIYISSDSTLFERLEKCNHVDFVELLKKYKEIIKMSKDKKVKISYRDGTKKFLENNQNEYEIEYQKYVDDFEKLAYLWKNKLENGGIKVGYSDDVIVQELIKPLSGKIKKYFHRNELLSQVNELAYKLNNLHEELSYKDCNLGKIYL